MRASGLASVFAIAVSAGATTLRNAVALTTVCLADELSEFLPWHRAQPVEIGLPINKALPFRGTEERERDRQQEDEGDPRVGGGCLPDGRQRRARGSGQRRRHPAQAHEGHCCHHRAYPPRKAGKIVQKVTAVGCGHGAK